MFSFFLPLRSMLFSFVLILYSSRVRQSTSKSVFSSIFWLYDSSSICFPRRLFNLVILDTLLSNSIFSANEGAIKTKINKQTKKEEVVTNNTKSS